MAADPTSVKVKPRTKNSNLVLSLLALYIGYVVYSSLNDGNIPEVPDSYWGKEGTNIQDESIVPFKISTEDTAALAQLKSKLEQEIKSNRLQSDTTKDVRIENKEAAAAGNVMDTNLVQNVAQYWKDSYKWNERVKLLNKFPHFTTVINGLKIHFQRIKVEDVYPGQENSTAIWKKNPRPLLLIHGWPNSFIEFQKLIPLLLDNEKVGFSFELIIPSLPGFGYSEGSSKAGLGPVAISQILLKLMQRVGHNNFYVHGSNDWGSVIATTMATVYPVNVVGIHLHQCMSKHPKSLIRHLTMAALSYFITSSDESLRATSFYIEPAGTSGLDFARPDIISVALANSPAGLLAYILEINSAKFTGQNGEGVNIDDILDNVMVYWLTNSIISSSNIFINQMNKAEQMYNLDSVATYVPTMCTFYPSNTNSPQQSQSYLTDKFAQILRLNEESEQSPALIARNIIDSFNVLENKGFAVFDRKHSCYVANASELNVTTGFI